MLNKTFHKYNFHKHTFCIFKEVDSSEISTLKLNFKSKSGSSYYFTENGVYRLSNHWSRVANCKWRIINNNNNPNIKNQDRTKLGFAKWTDFYQDDDYEKLYFIEVNYDLKEVNYFHKNSSNFKNQLIRTASETTKIIKQIRILLGETVWAKHFTQDIHLLRKKIISELISSNSSLQEIKRKFL